MNRILASALILVAAFGLGAYVGWHQHTVRDNAAIVKQVVKVAKVDVKNQTAVENQNGTDATKITDLQRDLAATRAAAAARGVPVRACRTVPSAQADAGSGAPASPGPEPAGSDEAAYQRLRDQILIAGAVAEQLRLQVQSCQAQWPK